MKLIVLTKEEAAANQGEYKTNHFVTPIKIEDNFYILNRDLSEVPELIDYKDAILAQPYFVVGDKSEYDLKYQQYLLDSQKEV